MDDEEGVRMLPSTREESSPSHSGIPTDSRNVDHEISRWPKFKLDAVCFSHCFLSDIIVWLKTIADAFGLPMVSISLLTYGLNQGVGGAIQMISVNYFWKDVQRVNPAASQFYTTISSLPWDCKPIYGLIMDTYPILGYHRWPYIAISGCVGTICWIVLTLSSLSSLEATFYLTLISLSTAVPDVTIDGLVALRSKLVPHLATDMQTLLWSGYAVGGLAGYTFSSFLLSLGGCKASFWTLSFVSLVVTLSAILWRERTPQDQTMKCLPNHLNSAGQSSEHENGNDPSGCNSEDAVHLLCVSNEKDQEVYGEVKFVHEIDSDSQQKSESIKNKKDSDGNGDECINGTSTNTLLLDSQSNSEKKQVGDSDRIANQMGGNVEPKNEVNSIKNSCQLLFQTVSSPAIWKPSLYIYIACGGSCPDVSQALFYWLTDNENGLSFSQSFMSFLYAMGFIGMIFGLIIYNKWLSSFSYRRILFYSQVILLVAGMLDLILVTRFNLWLRIPDEFFSVGDKTAISAVEKIQLLPLLVLSAKLCTPKIESSLFAFLMSVSNLGRHTGEWLGALLMHSLGVRKGNYRLLWVAIVIRNFMRLFPIPFLFLVPGDEDSEGVDEATAKVGDDGKEPILQALEIEKVASEKGEG